MNDYYYSVSLRITHPSLNLNDNCHVLDLNPKHYWKAGEQRQAPKGKLLDGVYKESYWTSPLHTRERIKSTEQSLDVFLDKMNNRFDDHKELFDKITNTGGQVRYFIGLFGDNNVGLTLQSELLRLTAELNISIELDVYT